MVGVELSGLVYEAGGYAEATRSILRGLKRHGIAVALRVMSMNFPKISLPPDLVASIEEAARTPARPGFPVIQLRLANGFQPEPGRYVIGLSMLESDRINSSWVDGCNRIQEVWVPSKFNWETFTRSGARNVRVMPLGVDVDRFRPGLEPIDWLWKASFRFFATDWFLRKGPDLLVHAYFQAFSRQDDVLLIIKIWPFSRDEAEATISAIANHYGGPYNTPPVALLHILFSWDDMPRLYDSMDCFVLPTRGEGWGFPVIEAMACGLPVICTNWSGPTEFINEQNSFPVRIEGLEPIPNFAYNEVCFQNGNWAKPSVSHLAELMRYVYDHRDEAREKGKAARAYVAEHFTWEKSTLRMANRIREIVGRN